MFLLNKKRRSAKDQIVPQLAWGEKFKNFRRFFMSISFVALEQNKKDKCLKKAYGPPFYKEEVVVNSQNFAITAIDALGKDVIFESGEIYFTSDGQNFELCVDYCASKDIQLNTLFQNARSIAFMSNQKTIMPCLSSMMIVQIK